MEQEDMDLERMKQIVDEARDAEFYRHQLELQEWKQEQQAKAPQILALLRQHIPAERLPEVEEFLSTGYGCNCLCDLLRREQDRQRLREQTPPERWPDIEVYLDTGVFPADHAPDGAPRRSWDDSPF